MIKYDKYELLTRLIGQVTEGSEAIGAAAEGARQHSIDAPGAMKSRYDSSKEESGYLADGLNTRRHELGRDAIRLTRFSLPENPEYVGEGTVVRVETDGSEFDYFIAPTSGGKIIEMDGGIEVTVMTPSAPLCSQMLGKSVGQRFEFRERSYEIIGIK